MLVFDSAQVFPTRRSYCVISSLPAVVKSLQHTKNAWDADMLRVERVYGMHAAWEKRMDRAMLSQVQRLPGGPASSFVGLDTFLNRDIKMGFEDTLGRE